MPAPLLDSRSRDKLRAQLRILAGTYVPPPRWVGAGDDADPAWRLLQDVFTRLLELLIERFNQVPDMHFLRFLNFVGVERSPGSAAVAPVTFLPSEQSTGGEVPAGTQVATTQTESEEAQVFETRETFFATPAKLIAVVNVVPRADRYAVLPIAKLPLTPDALATGPMVTALTDAPVLPRIDHIVYLGDAALFGRKDVVDLTIEFDLSDDRPAVFSNSYLLWERYDATSKSWTALSASYAYRQASPQASVTLPAFSGSAPSAVAGVKNNWIRCRYVGPMLSPTELPNVIAMGARLGTPGGQQVTTPALAFANAAPLDLSRPFLPFGERPRQGDTFFLSSPDAFDPAVGSVTVSFKIQPYSDDMLRDIFARIVAATTITTDVQWQYVDAAGRWTNLTRFIHTITATPGATIGIARSTTRDGVSTTTDDGTIFGTGTATTTGFTISPAPLFGRGTVNGKDGAWIRALLMNRDPYGRDGFLTTTSAGDHVFVGPSFVPPIVEGITLAYAHRTARLPIAKCVVVSNFSEQASGLPLTPFVPIDLEHRGTRAGVFSTEPALYFGFNQRLDVGFISLFVQLDDRASAVTAAREGGGPRIAWEYVAEDGGWRPLDVRDETSDLTGSGTVGFSAPPDQAALSLFPSLIDTEGFWLRARLAGGRYDYPPQLHGVYVNTVFAENRTTDRGPIIVGSSTGEESQRITLIRAPVLSAQVWVREPERPSPPELQELFEESQYTSSLDPTTVESVALVTDLIDASPALTSNTDSGSWVRWRRVPTFLESGPRSRHYTFDAVAGVLTFGDGARGLIPAPVRDGITLRAVRTGGGEAANRAQPLAIKELKTSLPFVDKVFNVTVAAGGSRSWDENTTLQFGPQEIKNHGRAVTTEDYEWLVRQEFGQVARVRALPITAPVAGGGLGFAPGAVTMIIVPKTTDPTPQPTSGLLRRVREYLQGLTLGAITADIHCTGPDYTPVRIAADIRPVDPGQASSVSRRVVSALESFFHPLSGGEQRHGWEFGRNVYISEVYAVLERTDGVDYVANVTLLNDPGSAELDVPDNSLVASGAHLIRIV